MATNNTSKHIADEARYISFSALGTRFPSSITTVQDALALTSPTSQATETEVGVLRIATLSEIDSGTNDSTVVTPLKLRQALQRPDATEDRKGVAQIATQDEVYNGTDNTKFVTPLKLQAKIAVEFANRIATEQRYGVIKLSTTVQAQAGTDDTTAITPLKLQQAIANVSSSVITNDATESTRGLVQLATVGQAQQGTIRDGYAISPYTLQNLTGNSNRRGIVQAASSAQANQGQDDSIYISAQGFQNFLASGQFAGTVKLTDRVGTEGTGLALSAKANVISDQGGTINGNLAVNGNLTKSGKNVLTEDILMPHVPIGTILMWATDNDPTGGKFMVIDGRSLSKGDYPELFAIVGYRYGGSGDQFNIPDGRGLFMRMQGTGQAILNERGTDSKGKPKLGEGVNGGAVGEIQKQQLKSHKHAIGDGDYNRAWFRFGASVGKGYGGGRNRLWDSNQQFTNDGYEFEDERIRDSGGTLNTKDLIGEENRPWNMSINYIIKVK